MPKKKGRKSGTPPEPPRGAFGQTLGGFFGGGGGGDAGADGGGPGGGGLFGNVFGESISSPFGKASELAMAEAEDDDDYESPMTTPTAAGREESERAEREARERAEREAREKAEREAREKAEREARERTEREEKEKARKKQEEEAAKEKAAKAKQEAQALDEKKRADAKKKADAIKAESARNKQQELVRAGKLQAKSTSRPSSATITKETTLDKVNELLLQHSSKWEVRVSVDDTMAASWLSHVQARTLMQQLRLRLLMQPPSWQAPERPSLLTVVAAGLIEFGALDVDQRNAFLVAQGATSSTLTVTVLVHETEKATASVPLVAMKLEDPLKKDQAPILKDGLNKVKNVSAAKKSVASSWNASTRSKDAEIPRSVGTLSAMLTAGLFCWDRLSEE